MIWIIIGLISFTIQMYILKHTWVDSDKGLVKFRWEKAKRLGIQVWVVLVMFLGSIIPILNIAEFIAFWTIWSYYYTDYEKNYSHVTYTYWRFKDKFLSRKI